MPDKIKKSQSEWRKQLTPMQFAVTREKATELVSYRWDGGGQHGGDSAALLRCHGCGIVHGHRD